MQINEFQSKATDLISNSKESLNGTIASTSVITSSTIESFSTTVVSHEVVTSATKLTASTSLNPFHQSSNPDGTTNMTTLSIPLSSSQEFLESIQNPFTMASDFNSSHASVQSITTSSSSTMVASSTTIISTDLHEFNSIGSATATPFDQLIGSGEYSLVDHTIDDDGVPSPPLPSIPPPTTTQVSGTAQQQEPDSVPPPSTDPSKSQMFIL